MTDQFKPSAEDRALLRELGWTYQFRLGMWQDASGHYVTADQARAIAAEIRERGHNDPSR